MRSSTAERNDAHKELHRALAAACMRAGLQWLPKVKGLCGPHPNSPPGSTAGCERRMDLFIWQGAYRLLVDGTRIDGATDSYLRRALAVSQPLHGVEEAEKEKHKRYPDSPAPMEFKPVAVGTQIELGASAREVIGMLAKRAAARTSAGLTPTSAAVARETRVIMGELGVGVMRAQAPEAAGQLPTDEEVQGAMLT